MDRIVRVLRRMCHRIFYYSIYKKKDVILYGVPKYINAQNVIFGKNVRINDGVLFHAAEKIIIGDNVTFSYGATILTETYIVDDMEKYIARKHRAKKILIGNNVWIGANVTVLPGVEIVDNVVVGAGSVVTHDLLEQDAIYAGNPAKKIKVLGQ